MRLHQHKSAKSGTTTMRRSLGWLLIGGLVLAVTLASGGYYAGQRRVCASTSASEEGYLMEIDKMKRIPGGRLEETPLNPYFSDEFIRLYEAPCAHYGHAVGVLASDKYTAIQKRGAVLSMQRLPAGDYFALADNALTLFKERKIDRETFDFVFFPYLEINATSQKYFWHPTWRKLLKHAASVSNDADFQRRVDDKLSGRVYWAWVDHRKE